MRAADPLQTADSLTFPLVVGQLLEILDDSNHDRADLEQVVRTDPDLTIRILSLVNSASYRRRSTEIDSIDAALSLVGESVFMKIVLASSADFLRSSNLDGYGIRDNGLWLHSMRTAIAAEQVASTFAPHINVGIAYTAGLLCDVGKLLLGPYVDEGAAELDSAMQTAPGFDLAEREVLGTDHAEVGGRLAEQWKLPPSICLSVRHHHHPMEAPSHRDLALVIHLADAVAMLAGSTGGIDAMRYPLDPTIEAVFPFFVDEMTTIVVETATQAAAWMAAWGGDDL